ncbi:MAG: DUF427 domain-containing protein [Chloroflexi bacterium]|nr:DUF427 domain-containing protein [Chloroflexota bacterium]
MAKTQTPMVFAPTGSRIKALFNGETLAESDNAMLFRESPFKLFYFFPKDDVNHDLLVESDHVEESGLRGRREHWHIEAGDRRVENGAFAYVEEKENRPDLRAYVGIEMAAPDAWFEEDEELIGHPRDPYTRIDVRRSARHIRVAINGTTVAETNRALILYETGLVRRYYIPKDDVHTHLFTPTATHTICPYKGEARYWSFKEGDVRDVVWAYDDPFDDAARVQGTMCFYQERDEVSIYVDGELEETAPAFFTK